MKRLALGSVVVLLTVVAAPVRGQVPDFSGTWKLDPSKSQIAEAAGLAGLIGAGVPEMLHVTQTANGAVVVESQINESHSRIYKPSGKTATPVGQAGTITMTSKLDGATLVSEGRQETVAGDSTIVRDVKEVFALSADGRTLTINVTTTAAGDTNASTLVFTRTQAAGPCESWPTPCKAFPQPKN